jgi:hypothetical protein
MNLPGFSAEVSIYRTSGYFGRSIGQVVFEPQILPAIPPCRSCENACDSCIEKRVGCTACAMCAVGDCDPCPPGGCRPPEPGPFEDWPFPGPFGNF